MFLEGKSHNEIKERLDVVCADYSPSMISVKKWFDEFQRGHTLIFDKPRPGAPLVGI